MPHLKGLSPWYWIIHNKLLYQYCWLLLYILLSNYIHLKLSGWNYRPSKYIFHFFLTPIEPPPPQPYEENDNQVPRIELRAVREQAWRAAERWLHDILNILRTDRISHRIRNNHIQHFGQQEHSNLLSIQTKFSVGLQMCYTADDQASITVTGQPHSVTAAVLEVEAMCCEIQEASAKAAEETMLYSVVHWVCKDFPEMENPEINATLERAYLAGKDVVHINSYISVDFRSMAIQSPRMKCKMERKCKFIMM